MLGRILPSAILLAQIFLCASSWSQSLAIYPDSAQLDRAEDLQSLVLVQTREDGVTLDVTAKATVSFATGGKAEWLPEENRLRPMADGQTTVTFEYEGQQVSVPVAVQNAGLHPPISFRNDVEPALMKAGCNTGACHGSAKGQNGFHLTLFGYDPAKDYIHITRQTKARRLNPASPKESLFLLKPLGQVQHEGGTKITEGDHLYTTFLRWIEEGAQDDPGEVPHLTELEILPPLVVLEGEGSTQQMTVRATYSDGTDRDVTHLAILESGDSQTVAIDDSGVATAGGRGEAYLSARFGTKAVVSQFIVIPKDLNLEWPDLPEKNYIDSHVFAKLKKLRIPPAEVCSDEVFLRRVYLDTIGSLPTVEETREFLADTGPDKRGALIDRLLDRPEFVDVWATKWADLLRVKSTQELDRKAMHRYNDWIRQSIASNKPIGQMVTEILSAEGGNFKTPAANFYVIDNDPSIVAENVAQVFLGLQIKCAQCHNHPFERWTMDDYYSFAAFFAQIGKKGSDDLREAIIYDKGSGEVRNLRNNEVMQPKFLGGPAPDVAGQDRRAVLADWIVSSENPWFSKNIANRVWQHYFGVGIIDPVDDVRVTNPPTHPDLLEELGSRLIEYDYDLRKLIRDIAGSTTYQLSTRPRDTSVDDRRNFSHALLRRMEAEQLLDSISKVTESKFKFANLPLGARASQVADGDSGNYFLSLFGRPARDSVCACERRGEPNLAQALHLINGDTLQQAIRYEGGRFQQQVAGNIGPATVVEELYLAAYCRLPREEEKQAVLEFVAQAENTEQALEDTYWSVLNSKEFVFNH
jgi:hypothetical protein